jgi:selT/selW/selH-like putative selenoprotein
VAAVQKAFGNKVQTETLVGSGGIYDVKLDGELIFSKHQAGRFPANQEIVAEIARRQQKA